MDLIEIAKEVSSNVNIKDVISSYIPVIKYGRNYRAVCPFHNDTNPSLSISLEKNIFKCFVCGAGGSAIGFVQRYEGISFREAVIKTAEIGNVAIPELRDFTPERAKVDPLKTEHDLLKTVSKFYQVSLHSEQGKAAVEYLKKRHISPQIMERFALGYSLENGAETIKYLLSQGASQTLLETLGVAQSAGDKTIDRYHGRIIFPIFDENGHVAGFSGRYFGGDKNVAKYVNSPESPAFIKSKILYNLHRVKNSVKINKSIYLCEGFMDVIALDRLNIDAIASMGTALSREQVQLLRPLKATVKILLDGDSAGRLASLKMGRALYLNRVPVTIIHQPGELRDPDEIWQADGESGVHNYLKNELSYPTYLNQYYQGQLGTTSSKKEYLALVYEILGLLSENDPIEFEQVGRAAAKTLSVSFEALKLQYEKEVSKANETYQHGLIMGEKRSGAAQISQVPTEVRRLVLYERYLLSLMVKEPLAFQQFKASKLTLSTEIYQEIVDFIQSVDQKNEPYDFNSLVTILESGDIHHASQMKDVVMERGADDSPESRYSEAQCQALITGLKKEQTRVNNRQIRHRILQQDRADETKIKLIIDSKKQEIKKKSE